MKYKGIHAIRKSKSRRNAVKLGFASAFEHKVAIKFTRAGIDYEHEPFKLKYYVKPTIKCTCNKCGSNDVLEEHTYLPDFVIGKIIIETKGIFSAKDRKKMLAVRDANSDYMYILVFQDGSKKLNASAKTSYNKWAQKNDFEYCNANSIVMLIRSIIGVKKK